MPLEWPYWPVRRQARLPEHVGTAQNAWRKSTPWLARWTMLGVATAKPYGSTNCPVSCEWRYRRFGGRLIALVVAVGAGTEPTAKPGLRLRETTEGRLAF